MKLEIGCSIRLYLLQPFLWPLIYLVLFPDNHGLILILGHPQYNLVLFFFLEQDFLILSQMWSPYWSRGRNLGWLTARRQKNGAQVSNGTHLMQWTLGYMYLFEVLFSPDICPGVGFLDHMTSLFLVFWGSSIPFSIVAAPIYIPTNRVGGFPFFHSLSSICDLKTFWWWPFWPVWGGTSL